MMMPRSITITSSSLTNRELAVSTALYARYSRPSQRLSFSCCRVPRQRLQIVRPYPPACHRDRQCVFRGERRLVLILFVDKQGISKKFLSFMTDLDKSVGQRALGPEQTVSSKVQSTFKEAHSRAKSIDEQKGYLKTAQGVHLPSLSTLSLLTRTTHCSIM